MLKSHGDDLRISLAKILKSSDKRTLGLLEKKSGVDRSVISRILSYETKNPRLHTVLKLKRAIDDLEGIEDSPKENSLVDDEVIGALEKVAKSEDDRSYLTEVEKSTITKTSFSSYIYGLISACGDKKIFKEDIIRKYGVKKSDEINRLIESELIAESKIDGSLTTTCKKIAIEDSQIMLNMASADLEYFDQEALGLAAAMARRNGKTSKQGIELVRKAIYEAVIKIAKIPDEHEGDIPFHANLFGGVYDVDDYLHSKN